MPQDRYSGKEANEFGHKMAAAVAEALALTLTSPGRSNLCDSPTGPAIIKTARKSIYIGILKAELPKLRTIYGVLAKSSPAQVYELTSEIFDKHKIQPGAKKSAHLWFMKASDIRASGKLIAEVAIPTGKNGQSLAVTPQSKKKNDGVNQKRAFKLPSPPSIMGRSSSITNAFISAVMPVHVPTDSEVGIALEILELKPEAVECIYCGGRMTEWDHLRPIVLNRAPTGYFTSIFNLVPSCGPCNQSKGNKPWRTWLENKHASAADLQDRIRRIQKYEDRGKVAPVLVEDLVGKKAWADYMGRCEAILALMRSAEIEARVIRLQLKEHSLKSKKKS